MDGCLYVCVYVCVCVCLIYLSICLSIHVSVYLSICLSVYLSVCLTYIQTSIHPYIHCRSSSRGASRSGSSRGGDRFHGSRPIQVGGERVPRGNGRICTWSPRPPVLSHLLLFPCTFRFSFTRCRARAERDKPESVLAVLVRVLRFLSLQWQSSTCLGSNSAGSITPEASSHKTACSGCLPF